MLGALVVGITQTYIRGYTSPYFKLVEMSLLTFLGQLILKFNIFSTDTLKICLILSALTCGGVYVIASMIAFEDFGSIKKSLYALSFMLTSGALGILFFEQWLFDRVIVAVVSKSI
jgi:hypothetical protein